MRPLAVKSLPEGYTKCEHLESTGTQYIDTGVELTNNHSVELTSQMTMTDVISCAVFGTQAEGNQQGYAFSLYQSKNSENLCWFFYKTTSTAIYANSFPEINVYDKMQIGVDGGLLRINGQNIKRGASGEFSTGKTCWIFDRNSYTDPTAFYGKIFNFKISRNGLVLNLQPTLDPTGVPCMFDFVTKKPFYNENTSSSDFLYKAYSYPFNPSDNWHTVNKKIKEIIGSTKYTLELVEDGN